MRIKAIYPGFETLFALWSRLPHSLYLATLTLSSLCSTWARADLHAAAPAPARSPPLPRPSLKAGYKVAGCGGGLQLRPAHWFWREGTLAYTPTPRLPFLPQPSLFCVSCVASLGLLSAFPLSSPLFFTPSSEDALCTAKWHRLGGFTLERWSNNRWQDQRLPEPRIPVAMETGQPCGGMGTVSCGGMWGSKGEGRGTAPPGGPFSLPLRLPKGCTPNQHALEERVPGLRLGGGHGAWLRACARQAPTGGLSICSGCEVTLLWVCHRGASTLGLLPISLGHLGHSFDLGRTSWGGVAGGQTVPATLSFHEGQAYHSRDQTKRGEDGPVWVGVLGIWGLVCHRHVAWLESKIL